MCFRIVQVRSQILASDMSKALRLPAPDLLSEPASQLYGLVNVLSRRSSLVGLPLQEWVSLGHELDSDVPEKQQLESLFIKALSVASRYALVCVSAIAVTVVIELLSHRNY